MLEDQDLGTFRATTPERGGFLYPDGSPISLAELADATPENAVDLPIDTDEITPTIPRSSCKSCSFSQS